MSDPKEKILHYFQNAFDDEIKEALLVSKSKKEQVIHSVPRLVIITSGQQQIEYFSSKGLKQVIKGSGTAQYCGKNGYIYHKFITPSQAISLSYYGKFIRCMHINYNGKDLPPTSRDTFYHTNTPLSKLGQDLLKVLDDLAENKRYQTIAPSLLKALLHISIKDISINDEKKMLFFSSSYKIWRELDAYLKLHFKEDLSRESIAQSFNISSSHLSHLFNKFGGESFSSILTRYRLEYAAMLLKQTRLSLDEIAEQCNYKYTSYFVRSFKNKYKMTPNNFRCSNN